MLFFNIFLPIHKLQGPSSVVSFNRRVFQGVVWSRLEVYFFHLKSSNRFSVKLIFGRSFIFCTFVCNHGAFILRLSASVTMERPAKTLQKMNINRLDLRVRNF